MSKLAVLILAGLLAFVAGLAGIYAAMPYLAPEVVDAAQARLDSLDRVSRGLPPDPEAVVPDSVLLPRPDYEALQEELEAMEALVASLRDSLADHRALVALRDDAVATRDERMVQLRSQIAVLEARRQDAESMSATLAKLEDKELSALLGELKMDILEEIFAVSSARNRTRFLQAMPSSRASVFVQRVMGAPRADADASASADASADAVPGAPSTGPAAPPTSN